MRRSLLPLLAALSMLVMAHGQPPGGSGDAEAKKVDLNAETMNSVPGIDSAMRLVGNVVLHHNGAVITCDSAYRYSDKHLECFGRVLINKDSTFIYGDRAKYDGVANVAQVFAPLVKVVDGDAVLYTYNFSFNTLDNIGTYWGGGTMTQNENRLESERGFYYSDTREFVCVNRVQGTDPEYKLMSDSVRYNMDTETAEFYTPTIIWNAKGEIYSGSRGRYLNQTAQYEFTRDAYILTEQQEVWCDSLQYDSRIQDAVLRRNIQIRDEEQKIMAFGDYGQYWGDSEEALLTIDPSLVTFDPEQDSLYLRSDSMFVYSIAYDLDFKEYDSLRRMQHQLTIAEGKERMRQDSLAALMPTPEGLQLPADGSGSEGEREDRDGHRLSDGNATLLDELRWSVVNRKREMYEAGDTLRVEMLTAPVMDSLLNVGVASEDIQGILKYNERKRELEEQGVPVSDILLYEVLESVGAFADLSVPETGTEEAAADGVNGEAGDAAGDVAGAVESGAVETTEAEVAAASEAGQAETDEGEKSAADEQKPLSRRERRKQEREREAEAKREARKEKEAAEKEQEAAEGQHTEALADTAARDIPVISDSLRNRFEEMGVDPETFTGLPDGGETSPEQTLVAGDSSSVQIDSLGMPIQPIDGDTPAKQQDSLQRIIMAYRNVRVYRTDMQAVCDSLVAFSKDSTAHLYVDPIMWNNQNQITAEVIDLYTRNQKLARAFFTGWPLMISEVDSTQYNQIKGREMESFFRDNEIYWHNVKGNAQTLYYMMDDDAGEANAFLVVNSASIGFQIEDQQMVRMTWHQEPDAAAYPIDGIPLDVDRFLDGFRWEAGRRPGLADVFTRTIRPTEREHYEALPQPEFPLTQSIEEDKKRLFEMRIWEDRVDTLAPHALEFLRYLGVSPGR